MYSSPAVANGVVYVGSFDAKVYALNATTGATLWTATTGGDVISSPAVANGVVYVGSDGHQVLRTERHDGGDPLVRHHRRPRGLLAGGGQRGRLRRV